MVQLSGYGERRTAAAASSTSRAPTRGRIHLPTLRRGQLAHTSCLAGSQHSHLMQDTYVDNAKLGHRNYLFYVYNIQWAHVKLAMMT